MRDKESKHKSDRVLEIFFLALKGEELSVKALSERYGISSRSVSRCIGEIKAFLAEHRDIIGNAELEYSSATHHYSLKIDSLLTNQELLSIAKILIASRAYSKDQLVSIMSKLDQYVTTDDRKRIENMLRKEIINYTPVYSDNKDLPDTLWRISDYIAQKQYITISYYKMDRTRLSYRIRPMSILFSEYYFYLIAYKKSDETPYYFRLDRIVEITAHREFFSIEHNKAVDEGTIRQTSQYMFPGKNRRIRFSFSGLSVQAILDRIPSAKIVEQKDGKYIIEADVFGAGIKMFLLSQGAWVEVLSPPEFRKEMIEELNKMTDLYTSPS